MTSQDPLRVALVSLGCPKNLVDSEAMLGRLGGVGCIVSDRLDDADVAVINTCGFLASARDESHAVIAEAVELKRRGLLRRVVVVGCLAQRDGESLLDDLPGVDAVLGVNDHDRIIEAVAAAHRRAWLSDAPTRYPSGAAGDAGRFRLTPRHTAYLRIAEGCSQHCSFCTIPAIRGPFRSKPVELILAEAAELLADGARELSVIAQDTTAYGEDLADGTNLAGLLRRLDTLDVSWIRLMYTYPRRFDDELIETLRSADRVIPYIDMPLQHIATPILQAMRRRVTGDDCRALLDRLYDRIEGLSLRTSFIVGFPGETDEQFAELVDLVEEYAFEAMGVFCFSPEPGTPAAALPNAVPAGVAEERAVELMTVQRDLVFERNEQLVEQAQPLEVLVDHVDEDGRSVGRFYGQAPDIDGVCLLTEPAEPGEFVDMTVVGYDDYDLIVA